MKEDRAACPRGQHHGTKVGAGATRRHRMLMLAPGGPAPTRS
jgi:hypothetical protein